MENYQLLTESVAMAQDKVKQVYEDNMDDVGARFNEFYIHKKRVLDIDLLIKRCPEAIEYIKYTMPLTVFDPLVESGVISEDIAEECISEDRKIQLSKK